MPCLAKPLAKEIRVVEGREYDKSNVGSDNQVVSQRASAAAVENRAIGNFPGVVARKLTPF